eukprot:Gb_07124 [translate_table: standard]
MHNFLQLVSELSVEDLGQPVGLTVWELSDPHRSIAIGSGCIWSKSIFYATGRPGSCMVTGMPVNPGFRLGIRIIYSWFVWQMEHLRVTINGMDIDVNEGLIAKVTGLPNDGETVSRDKMDHISQLTKFIKETETFCCLDSGIARESLLQPWDRVDIQVRKTKSPRHQGLMKLIVEFNFKKYGSPMGPSRGAVYRISKKRKLSGNLAKSSRRSTRLQRKSARKSKVIFDADSVEEEQKIDMAQAKEGRSSPSKGAAMTPSKKGEGRPDDSQHQSKDLLGHL